jgi:hypothetical protein
MAKRNSHRYIRSVRPTAQSHDEFADTRRVLLYARTNDTNSHP